VGRGAAGYAEALEIVASQASGLAASEKADVAHPAGSADPSQTHPDPGAG